MAKAQTPEGGGKILYEILTPSDQTLLAQDADGGAFFMVQSKQSGTRRQDRRIAAWLPVKWKTAFALASVWFGLIMDLNSIWGVLFILWVVSALRAGRIYFVEAIDRYENAFLYWMLIGTWLLVALDLILWDLAPIAGLNWDW